MLCGVPASGKSTWISNNVNDDSVIVSSDKYIEQYAEQNGMTYTEAFPDAIGNATSMMYQDLSDAIKNDKDIYWDQTNLTPGARAKKLKNIPDHYTKIAVYFPPPEYVEWSRRLSNRGQEKNVPVDVLVNMLNQDTKPTRSEGFDKVIVAGQSGFKPNLQIVTK